MPQVRGSTRVFGIINGGDDWYDNFAPNLKSHHHQITKSHHPQMEIIIPSKKPEHRNDNRDDDDDVNKRFGVVYTRKRKRFTHKDSVLPEKKRSPDDKIYGQYYVRRKKKTRIGKGSHLVVAVESAADTSSSSSRNHCFLSVLLNSVFRYMKVVKIRLGGLIAFLFDESITRAFASRGIRFVQDVPSSSTSGSCTIFGATQRTPLFTVDFSALPFCFLSMHSTMLLRSERLVSVLFDLRSNDETPLNGSEYDPPCIPIMTEIPQCEFEDNIALNTVISEQTVGTPKFGRRNPLCRNGLNYRSIHGKRRSLRSRKARKPPLGVNKSFKASFSPDIFSYRNEFIPNSSSVSSRGKRGSVGSNFIEINQNIKEAKSTVVDLGEDLDISCCSANLLVIASDRCHREDGANILLELFPSDQWCLVVKRDGLTRYIHKAEQVMRPCTFNRFTHSIIWTIEDGWKLEFPNRDDWHLFKELYKQCSGRNIPVVQDAKSIPIPGVVEVPDYEDRNNGAPSFIRPDSYIRMHGDEVSRALANKRSNYDIDSEDEAWLNNFNVESWAKNEPFENVSEENFELILDAFEKSFFCSPDDHSYEKAANAFSPDLGRREVLKAVYNYWMGKRKQKRTPLVRFFQGHQPRRPQLTESVLRKKRSFKRQASQHGRAKHKQLYIMQAMNGEQMASEEKKARYKAEEAKVAANTCAEIAVGKRKRAQIFMEIADLAAYKATMALRIAEAARITGSSDAATLNFLD